MAKKATDKQKSNTDGRKRKMANLKPWKPGQSGNPRGRPKTRTLSEELRARLKEQYPGRSDATYGQMLAHKLVDLAIDGEIAAIREVFDRTEGKPKQVVDVNVEERKREMVEDAIARLIEEAQVSRDEAIEQLMAIAPEISQWIN
jgi:hypothetical protein